MLFAGPVSPLHIIKYNHLKFIQQTSGKGLAPWSCKHCPHETGLPRNTGQDHSLLLVLQNAKEIFCKWLIKSALSSHWAGKGLYKFLLTGYRQEEGKGKISSELVLGQIYFTNHQVRTVDNSKPFIL